MRWLLLSVLCFNHLLWAQSPQSFTQSKKIVYRLFELHPQTLYCGCRYQGKTVDLASCGMGAAQGIMRAQRVEIEHMFAAEHFGQHFACWRLPLCLKKNKPYRGRTCCEKTNADFRHLESELYNLT